MTYRQLSYSELGLNLRDVYVQMGYDGAEADADVEAEVCAVEELIAAVARPRYCYFVAKGTLDTVRHVLNVVFLVCAVMGLILYFALPERHILGMSIIAAGMFLKIVEFLLRFLF